MAPSKQKCTPAIRFIQSIDSTWKGHELFAIWIVKKLKPKVVVDLGFDRGLSTIAFAHGNRGQTFGIDWIGEQDYSGKKIAMETALHNISTAIRHKYVKNIHLIIGPPTEISRKWNCEIDLLHIDCTHRYHEIKKQYESWQPYLRKNGAVLIHDVKAYPEETGKFFDELKMPKILFPHGKGLGIATKNHNLFHAISNEWEVEIINPLS